MKKFPTVEELQDNNKAIEDARFNTYMNSLGETLREESKSHSFYCFADKHWHQPQAIKDRVITYLRENKFTVTTEEQPNSGKWYKVSW